MRNNQRRTRPSGQPQTAAPVKAAPSISGLAYEVPTEFVELPSRGLFYPEDHPLHKQETVEIKFLTAKEEDILASTALLKKGLLLDRLFESILVKDIDPKSLLIGDRSAIIIAARSSGYGAIYETTVECPNCSTKNNVLYDLKTAKTSEYCFDEEYINDNSVEINDDLFFITLPVTRARIGLRLLDGYGEQEFNKFTADNEDTKVTSTLSAFIEVVNDITDEGEITNFINNMPAKDSKYIRTIYPKLVPNIELKEDFTCKRCFHQQDLEVPLSAEFFWPR